MCPVDNVYTAVFGLPKDQDLGPTLDWNVVDALTEPPWRDALESDQLSVPEHLQINRPGFVVAHLPVNELEPTALDDTNAAVGVRLRERRLTEPVPELEPKADVERNRGKIAAEFDDTRPAALLPGDYLHRVCTNDHHPRPSLIGQCHRGDVGGRIVRCRTDLTAVDTMTAVGSSCYRRSPASRRNRTA